MGIKQSIYESGPIQDYYKLSSEEYSLIKQLWTEIENKPQYYGNLFFTRYRITSINETNLGDLCLKIKKILQFSWNLPTVHKILYFESSRSFTRGCSSYREIYSDNGGYRIPNVRRL